jgi:Kef-type K+ transport system membrane component KefB
VLFVIAAELGARGPLTDRAFNLVAINNVVAFLAYTALLPALISGGRLDASSAVFAAVWQILGALLLAWALTRLKLLAARWVGSGGSNQFALSLAMIVFALGMANMLGLSLLLSLLALGILSRNLDRSELLVDVRFDDLSSVFFVTLFVTSGANLHAAELVHAWYAVLAFALARVAGKWIGAMVATLAVGGAPRTAALTGLPLVPMAALAIGLVDMTQSLEPRVGAELGAIVLGAIAIFETFGPPATAYAMRSAGEVPATAKLDH